MEKALDKLAEEKPKENRVVVEIKDPSKKGEKRERRLSSSKIKRNLNRRSSIEMLQNSGQINHLVEKETDCLTRFLAGPLNKFIYRYRYLIMTLLALYGIFSAGLASQMGPISKQEEMINPDHPLIKT